MGFRLLFVMFPTTRHLFCGSRQVLKRLGFAFARLDAKDPEAEEHFERIAEQVEVAMEEM